MKKDSKNHLFAERLQERARYSAEKEFFGTRKKLNEEFIEYVKNREIGQDFWKAIKKIRKTHNIPRLNPCKDIICGDIVVGEESYEDCESEWFSSQNKKTQKRLEKEINDLIKEYNFPKNFFDWLQDLVLYKQLPPWSPFYNWELPFQLGNDSKELERIPLTVKEKKYIKYYFRKLFDIRRRPPKDKIEVYQAICQMLKRAKKNKKRPFRTLKTAVKTLEQGKTMKPMPQYDFYENLILKKYPKKQAETIIESYRKKNLSRLQESMEYKKSHKKTYADLVPEIYEGKEFFGKEQELNKRLRKQKQRLRERIVKVMGKKKLKK